MSEQFNINFTPAEGSVVRILGLVERRGYMVRGISMSEHADCASLLINVEPRDASRRIQVVIQQLGKLIEVNSVSLATRDAGSIA